MQKTRANRGKTSVRGGAPLARVAAAARDRDRADREFKAAVAAAARGHALVDVAAAAGMTKQGVHGLLKRIGER